MHLNCKTCGKAIPLKAPAKDAWFKYEIIVEGNHVVVKFNDKVTADNKEVPADFDKDKSIEPCRSMGEGTFALQARNPGNTVFNRNVKVKRLQQ